MRVILGYLRSTRVWLLVHPASLAVVTVALLCGSIAGIPAGGRMYDYMWRDPRFCDDCHVHDYANEAWARSVHSRLTTCHDCHRVPIRHYPENLYLAIFDRPQVPEDIPRPEVEMVICEQCHSAAGAQAALTGPMPNELRALVVGVDDSPLHTLHLHADGRVPALYAGGGAEAHGGTAGAAAVDGSGSREEAAADTIVCLDCHGGERLEVHRFTATSEACESCHEGIRPADESGRSLSCLDCHAQGFLGGSSPSATP